MRDPVSTCHLDAFDQIWPTPLISPAQHCCRQSPARTENVIHGYHEESDKNAVPSVRRAVKNVMSPVSPQNAVQETSGGGGSTISTSVTAPGAGVCDDRVPTTTQPSRWLASHGQRLLLCLLHTSGLPRLVIPAATRSCS